MGLFTIQSHNPPVREQSSTPGVEVEIVRGRDALGTEDACKWESWRIFEKCEKGVWDYLRMPTWKLSKCKIMPMLKDEGQVA